MVLCQTAERKWLNEWITTEKVNQQQASDPETLKFAWKLTPAL